jgi:uncharacterized protein (DUF1330 family)
LKYYAIAEIDITDPGWIPDYVANVTPMVERRGGRYLARTPQIEMVEGDRAPQGFLLIEWPSKEAADTFYESEEYRPYRDSRQTGSTGSLFLIAGDDVNGVAQIDRQQA